MGTLVIFQWWKHSQRRNIYLLLSLVLYIVPPTVVWGTEGGGEWYDVWWVDENGDYHFDAPNVTIHGERWFWPEWQDAYWNSLFYDDYAYWDDGTEDDCYDMDFYFYGTGTGGINIPGQEKSSLTNQEVKLRSWYKTYNLHEPPPCAWKDGAEDIPAGVEHFGLNEIHPHHPGSGYDYKTDLYLANPTFWNLMDDGRDGLGLPVLLSSGYRDPYFHRTVSSTTPNSFHQFGAAADIWKVQINGQWVEWQNLEPPQKQSVIDAFGENGAGLYTYPEDDHLHVRLDTDYSNLNNLWGC